MAKTWLIRRLVRRPLAPAVTARINSSVCRLPFIRSSPLASRTSATPLAAAASLWGASTMSKPAILRLYFAAVPLILSAGPTRIGLIIPSSAASQTPVNDDSSQGWTTIVTADGTCRLAVIRRSYLLCGGLASTEATLMARSLLILSRLGGLGPFDIPDERKIDRARRRQ